jgi:hypothetical protein
MTPDFVHFVHFLLVSSTVLFSTFHFYINYWQRQNQTPDFL